MGELKHDFKSDEIEPVFTGPHVGVPLALIELLQTQYFEGHCPIADGWGQSQIIEALLQYIPAPPRADWIAERLASSEWEVEVRIKGPNPAMAVARGKVSGQDQRRLIGLVLDLCDEYDAEHPGAPS